MEIISPGGSYNPSFQSHQALLLQAFEAEVARQKAEERLQRQLKFPTAAEAPTQESVFQEQCEGLMEEESEGEEGQGSPPGPLEQDPQAVSDEASPLFTATVVREKKTEQQRKKEKAAKRLKARELSEKAARLRKQELFQLKSIRLQLKQREAELQRRKQRREAKRKLEAIKPKRLGRLKYEEPDVDVQLSSELAESLRTLRWCPMMRPILALGEFAAAVAGNVKDPRGAPGPTEWVRIRELRHPPAPPPPYPPFSAWRAGLPV
ncbi:PREDICTED: glioma tumor suppressor candidate region gene 2 protein-like [Thamnophis sirtalis]|uniref:Ribosome biogenesis protein NOP53 n=1 Tax=Thamnophis sirtalis TaxID=35019 RepID=A0A6I9YRC0_9SAUR|nr:PREDICTED: glioma tumor suppressor candidate region gene 2 protein-like [Thamnophis sirtalis]